MKKQDKFNLKTLNSLILLIKAEIRDNDIVVNLIKQIYKSDSIRTKISEYDRANLELFINNGLLYYINLIEEPVLKTGLFNCFRKPNNALREITDSLKLNTVVSPMLEVPMTDSSEAQELAPSPAHSDSSEPVGSKIYEAHLDAGAIQEKL